MRSLFCGTGITVLRYVSSSAVFLASYEDLKKRLSKNTPHGKLNWSAVTIAGGFAGVFAYGFCVPLDVIKSRLQTAPEGRYPNGCRDVIREISRSEGSAGFFRGFIPTILRAFPTNSACFCGFELTLYIFRRLFPER
jgi:solute carrier family 25 carnitine/acylcarnitine transporter 20/29